MKNRFSAFISFLGSIFNANIHSLGAETVMSIYDRSGDEYSRSARERRSETVMREPGNTSG